MSANYTPNYEPNSNIQPFRFWCQKILPLVYDDSMSYYELLCKVVDYLNNVIENVNSFEDNDEALFKAFEDLEEYVNNYFTSLDVQTAINNALDEMVRDGTFDAALERVVSANINGVVADQLDDVVDSKLGGVVGDLIDSAVENVVGDSANQVAASTATTWLENNVTVTSGVTIDSSLSISGAAADAKVTGDKFAICNSEDKLNIYDCLLTNATLTNAGGGGLSFSYNLKNETVTVTGTATSTFGFNVLYANETAFPSPMKKGVTYFLIVPDSRVQLNIFEYINGAWVSAITASQSMIYKINNNASGVTIRLRIPTVSGTSYNFTAPIPKILNLPPIDSFNKAMDYVPDGGDLNDINTNSVYLLNSGVTYYNTPEDIGAGFVITIPINRFGIQLAFSYSGANVWKRKVANGVWDNWYKLSGTVNNYEFNSYENTYNISSSPELSQLGNDLYLESTGDDTDRTSDIAQLLVTYGCCNLGSGVFVVEDLVMPDNSIIQGYGNATIKLSDDAIFGIKLGSNCSVRDISVVGSSDVVIQETVRNKCGLLWQGNYTSDTSDTVFKGYVDNVKISNIEGSGIKCYDTGYGTDSGLNVSNCFIEKCDCGVNIDYWSEYCKFVNVVMQWNYYGCINNGGNNLFSTCDFSHNRIGFLIDDSNLSHPNNSHGTCNGCIFNHMLPNNTGYGIRIINAPYGYVFEGSQINSNIYISGSSGIVFGNNGMGGFTIRVEGGNTVLFNGDIFSTIPTRQINNNNKVFFANCYSSNGTPIT